MASRISRVRIINRRTSEYRAVDPAHSGAFVARLSESGNLSIMGLHNQIALRTKGALAAKWEAPADDAILLVLREEPEDEPVVVRAFRPRIGRLWQLEDAHGDAIPAPDGKFVAVKFSVPNHAVAILPAGKVVKEFIARANLGAPATGIAWADDCKAFTVTAPDQTLRWSIGTRQFRRLAL